MPAKEPLTQLLGIHSSSLSLQERIFLEADLFLHICQELKVIFTNQYKTYFKLIKSNVDAEHTMLDADFTRLIIKDILLTDEYTLDGIAHYANTHKDVVVDIALGHNSCPSVTFVQKVIALHRSVRPELYRSISKKFMVEYEQSAAMQS